MAPARNSRRAQPSQNQNASSSVDPPLETSIEPNGPDLFVDYMMGTPLSMYIEKDVNDREQLIAIVAKHGGIIAPGYSGVSYILVDPLKESGQNLYRQYIGKKGKIVLDSRWILECVKAGALQTYHSNWAGCKVTGRENTNLPPAQTGPVAAQPQVRRQSRPSQAQVQAPDPIQIQVASAPLQTHPQPIQQSQPVAPSPIDPLRHAPPTFQYPVYGPAIHQPERVLHPTTAAPPQTWQTTSAIAPQQTHMPAPPPHLMRSTSDFREETPWETTYDHTGQPAAITGPPPTPGYFRYREEQSNWVDNPSDFYEPTYETAFEHPPFIGEPPTANTSAVTLDVAEKPRGRKRTRNQAPATPASTLVMSKQNPPARSPTPPTRVIKSTYGGNLFTSDDILYLKKYIDYCQEQGLVLSLREICERIAVKAPHHTFYSWRRYCNKHQIRLGGYAMAMDRSPSPGHEGGSGENGDPQAIAGPGPGSIEAARQTVREDNGQPRNRSPTPPRALFRSTTGKGVAFTQEDITFLMRFMEYRKSQGRLDMVAFWKDVVVKAPHHSRASWMKFWRRHKHELFRAEGDEPLPQPPEKKMRYSKEDDILLAKYFNSKPEGTSDKIFQAFGRMHPHHPWKGWQEHHRIHKAEIDHIIQRLANGEDVEAAEPATE